MPDTANCHEIKCWNPGSFTNTDEDLPLSNGYRGIFHTLQRYCDGRHDEFKLVNQTTVKLVAPYFRAGVDRERSSLMTPWARLWFAFLQGLTLLDPKSSGCRPRIYVLLLQAQPQPVALQVWLRTWHCPQGCAFTDNDAEYTGALPSSRHGVISVTDITFWWGPIASQKTTDN